MLESAPPRPMPHPYLTDALRALAAEVVREAVQPAVASALEQALPEILRRAAIPAYLTRRQVMEMTGLSDRKLAYLQAERRISYLKRGRSVVFKTADVEAYLAEGYVPSKGAAARAGKTGKA